MDFLKELYAGNVSPADSIDYAICRNGDYKKAQQEFSKCFDAFKKHLNDDAIEELGDVLEAYTLLFSNLGEESFKLGFRLGVHMVCACFYDEDITER